MSDLDIPSWCNGSHDEFLRVHRSLLDSDLVSKELNNWIDLIFGYKLSGDAAFEAKNICSTLAADNQSQFKVHGIVQLFKTAHPAKIDFTGARKIGTNRTKVPDDIINTTKVLDDMEYMLQFVHSNYRSVPDLSSSTEHGHHCKPTSNNDQVDLKYAILILGELLLFDKVKVQRHATTDDRIVTIRKNLGHLPGFIQSFISNGLDNTASSDNYLYIDHLFNKHLTNLFNFDYFDDLYRLFEYIYKANFVVDNYFRLQFVNLDSLDYSTTTANDKQPTSHRYVHISGTYGVEYTSLRDLLNEQKLHLAKCMLPNIVIRMSSYKNTYTKQTNYFELLMPLINKNLFGNPAICLKSILFFFDKLAKFITVNELLNRNFLGILLDLLDRTIDLNSTTTTTTVGKQGATRRQLCLLFDYRFIRNLKISFGLNLFLMHIVCNCFKITLIGSDWFHGIFVGLI
jgi:hypothetical protein